MELDRQAELNALRPDLLRFARLQLRDAGAAEDAVQETLLAALTGSHKFESRSSYKTWLISILRNKIIDIIRGQSREISATSLAEDEAGDDLLSDTLFDQRGHWQPTTQPGRWADPEASFEQRQFWAVFEACLDHLPPKTARVFMMREFLGFETGEICKETGISSSNCWVLLHRARLTCKEATELMSQEQDRPLTLSERTLLRLHVWICSGCTNYRRQMTVLREACKRFGRGGTP
jgi:RNA polymerase sigma-70 factor (ECF subfamily)